MQSKKLNFLTGRLKNIEGPNWTSRNRETLYDFYRKDPLECYKMLDKSVIIDDKFVTVKEEVLNFNYMEFLKFKGIKVGEIVGYKNGLVFELK